MARLRRLLFGQELSLAPTKWVVRLADVGSRKNVMLVNSLALALGAVVTTCPLVSLCQVLPAQRCSGLDAFGGNADSDFFGGFRTDS